MRHEPESLDYFRLVKEAKRVSEKTATQKIKVALMADFASQQLVDVLKAVFFRSGVYADILEAEFDTIDHAVFSEDSPLAAFRPEFVIILESTQALRVKFHASRQEALPFAAERAEASAARWEKLRQKHPQALILQSNFVLPYERPFGHYGHKAGGTFHSAVLDLDRRIAEGCASHRDIFMLDMESIASYIGKRSWFDERLWALYKYPCALEFLPRIAQSVADIVLALKGATIKCVVVDLDNTLWGGVIGDDGVEGIRLGHGDEGEGFLLFQSFLLELKKRGILLAVCSKNDPENARLPFRQCPEMVLKEEDFAVFVANWNDKPGNLKLIRETLNIGFDAMLFLDDSPFERNLVRQTLPDIVVPELPEDAVDFVKHLSEMNAFEAASHSEADASRTRMYQEEFQRKLAKAHFESHDDYLRSLEMKISIERCTERQLPRLAQLLQRSNQFNLATRRYSEAQCGSFMKDTAGHLPLCVTLNDRFGDYGLIGGVVVAWNGPEASIEEWVMSCRVLCRGVEQCVMNAVFDAARQKGASRVIGRYAPTEKNKMVKDFYKSFGFAPADKDGLWSLETARYKPAKVWMEASVLV